MIRKIFSQLNQYESTTAEGKEVKDHALKVFPSGYTVLKSPLA